MYSRPSHHKPVVLSVKHLSKTFSKQGTPIEALKDISIEVQEGECIGIIGHNGSGKSTLLRVLAGITPPSSGYAKINGRVASVLEVGLGFHPDLSGRENLYLSAQLLGLSRQEIAQRRDQIISFSGIKDMIDRPVKQYSHGMFLRLAFSLATAIDADVLLFDEVLSVGDLSFQQKCRERLQSLKEAQKTLLLVSHDLQQILQLADKYLIIEKGRVSSFSNDPASIDRYIQQAHLERKAQQNDTTTHRLELLEQSYGIRINNLLCRNEIFPTNKKDLLGSESSSTNKKDLLGSESSSTNKKGLLGSESSSTNKKDLSVQAKAPLPTKKIFLCKRKLLYQQKRSFWASESSSTNKKDLLGSESSSTNKKDLLGSESSSTNKKDLLGSESSSTNKKDLLGSESSSTDTKKVFWAAKAPLPIKKVFWAAKAPLATKKVFWAAKAPLATKKDSLCRQKCSSRKE